MKYERASEVPDRPGPETLRRVVAIRLHQLNAAHPGRRYRLVTQRSVQRERPPHEHGLLTQVVEDEPVHFPSGAEAETEGVAEAAPSAVPEDRPNG
jgi:hypothetical protein